MEKTCNTCRHLVKVGKYDDGTDRYDCDMDIMSNGVCLVPCKKYEPIPQDISRPVYRAVFPHRKISIDTVIDILGAKWIVKTSTEKEEPRLKGINGFADWTSRLICIDNSHYASDCNLDNKDAFLYKLIRHELIHAFMFESGIGENWVHEELGQEEFTVDWFAFQIPKINKAFASVIDSIRWEETV